MKVNPRNKNHLSLEDYKNILRFYKIPIQGNLQKKAEDILSLKLCRCIKKIGSLSNNEARAIGICSKTVLERKGLTRGKFKCKGKRSITLKKRKK